MPNEEEEKNPDPYETYAQQGLTPFWVYLAAWTRSAPFAVFAPSFLILSQYVNACHSTTKRGTVRFNVANHSEKHSRKKETTETKESYSYVCTAVCTNYIAATAAITTAAATATTGTLGREDGT